MNTKLLTVLFVLCSCSLFAANMPFYVLSADNFVQDFNNIEQEDLSAFEEATGGVGIEQVRMYLEDLAGEGNFGNTNLDPPIMCLPEKLKDSLYVQASGEFDTFHFSFYRAQDGHNETTTSPSGKFAAYMAHDIFFNLLTIYGSIGNERSKLYIIIIEKDFFTCDSTHYEYQDRSDRDVKLPRISQDLLAFNSFPNPTSSQTQLSFHLGKNQKVSLDILSHSTGEIIARELDNQYLLKGDHQFEINLQSLPPGMYLLVLRSPYRKQSNLIVKAN